MDQAIKRVTPYELGKADAANGASNPFTPNTPSWDQWNKGASEVLAETEKATA
jgi:hypothetical protein